MTWLSGIIGQGIASNIGACGNMAQQASNHQQAQQAAMAQQAYGGLMSQGGYQFLLRLQTH